MNYNFIYNFFSDVICPWKNDEKDAQAVRKELTEASDQSDQNESEQDETNQDENSDQSSETDDDQNESEEEETDQERSKNSISGAKSDFFCETKNQNESEENKTDQEESKNNSISAGAKSDFFRETKINQTESEEDETDQEGSDVEEIDEDEPIEILAGNSNDLLIVDEKANSENFAFTPDEADRLETFFHTKKYIDTFEIEKLCKHGNFPEDKVREWFEMKKLIDSNTNREFKNDIIATDVEIDNFINEVEINVKTNQEKKSVGITNKIEDFSNHEKTIDIKTENVGGTGNNKKRKSFPCQSCDKTYTQSHSLKTHFKKVHEGLLNSTPTDFGIKKRKTVVASPPEEFNNWIEDLNQTKNSISGTKSDVFRETKNDDNVHKGHFLANFVDDDPKNSFGDNTNEKSTTIKLEKENFDGNKSETFSCQSCDKSYTRVQILRRHIKNVHEGIKEYSCQSCDKSYTQSHNLKNHIKKVHEGLKSTPLLASAEIKKEFRNSNSEKIAAFTPDEADRLETFFHTKKHINTFEIEDLGKHGNFPEDKVQEWFENRRLNTLGKWWNKTM